MSDNREVTIGGSRNGAAESLVDVGQLGIDSPDVSP
jgi:hypothetical protein